MRISDWSSDGCSSDLIAIAGGHSGGRGHGKQCGWPPSRGPLQAENEDMSLSDVAIRNAKPRAKPYKMGDSLGLFLLVQPSGDRKSVVSGKSVSVRVDLGGRRIIQQK